MPGALSYELHKLTARLDRAADAMLQRDAEISYSRFLALFAVRETGGSQRELAQWLGLTEPSMSRMVGVLAAQKLLIVSRVEGAGNRRQLQLTDAGARLVEQCSRLLEGRFAELVQRSRVPFAAYQRHTRALLAQLDADQQTEQDRPGRA
jgi:DNA-binding MarR family transcriptional regulator